MSEITPEVLTNFIVLQGQIWSAVTEAMSEELGIPIAIPTPTVEVIPIGDLVAGATTPSAQIRFAFSESPDETHLMRIQSQHETDPKNLQNLIKAVTGKKPESLDETTAESIRPFLESLVKGLGSTLSNLGGATFTPTNVEFTYETLTLPPAFLQEEQVIEVRLEVSLNEDKTAVGLVWLLSENAARRVCGLPPQKDETEFLTIKGTEPAIEAQEEIGTAFPPVVEGIPGEVRSIDLLMDIPLEVSVELGRVEMLIRDILELGSGSIVALHKAAGEPVEIMANGRLIARGEVVVVEDNFGVRITEIISPSERVQKLSA